MYERGEGVKQDKKKAVEFYRQAHEAGNADATYSLGLMYESGEGINQSKSKAAALYRQAKASGVTAATRKLTLVKCEDVKQKKVQKPKKVKKPKKVVRKEAPGPKKKITKY